MYAKTHQEICLAYIHCATHVILDCGTARNTLRVVHGRTSLEETIRFHARGHFDESGGMLPCYLKRMSTISSRDAASFVDDRRYYSMGIVGHCSMNEVDKYGIE